MSTKEQDKIFKNRVRTFINYVETFNDNDNVELCIYDFIAYILSNNKSKPKNDGYIELFQGLFLLLKEDTLYINGSILKDLYSFANMYSLPDDLLEELLTMYQLNERIRMINYNMNYKYYLKKEYGKYEEIKNKLKLELINKIDYIYNIDYVKDDKKNIISKYNIDYKEINKKNLIDEYNQDSNNNKKK